jgi:hypothetical protein
MDADQQPSALYGAGARSLQDQFDSRRLADRLVELTLHQQLTEDDIALIRAQSTVWISTVDAEGWPDVSYKGGGAGFVDVVSPTQLRVPSYDGNGMFRTLGNVVDNGRVAMLFVDTSRPWRLRLHGHGEVSTAPADTGCYEGAKAVLIVDVARVFPNCGRYIHTAEGPSKYLPAPGYTPPTPSWKQLPQLRDALPADDPARLPPDVSLGR